MALNATLYNFEVDLLMPPVVNTFDSSANFTFVAATTVYYSFFGLAFRTSYQTHTNQVIQTISAMISLNR